jgi:hypothetical protein
MAVSDSRWLRRGDDGGSYHNPVGHTYRGTKRYARNVLVIKFDISFAFDRETVYNEKLS